MTGQTWSSPERTDLDTPQPASDARLPLFLHLAAFAAAVGVALLGWTFPENFFRVSDADWYLKIAEGAPMQQVLQPFASRQLGPLVAHCLAALLRIPLEHAFVLEGLISLLVLAALVFGPLLRRATALWIIAGMLLVPFWPQLFHNLALPDLWYAALLAVFLFFLQKDWYLAAACWLFPLMLSRESTSLTLLCFLLACWRELRWPVRVLSVAATAMAAMLTSHWAAGGPGNTEHLPGALYIFLKVPWNTTRLLGVEPWSNRYPYLCSVPKWQVPLHLGQVSAVGVCGFDGSNGEEALAAATTTFGLLPVLATFLWWKAPSPSRRPADTRFALLYGGVSFPLAPLIGVSYDRLFGYAWPLLLVALPRLAAEPEAHQALTQRSTLWKGAILLQALVCAMALARPATAPWLGILLWGVGIALLWRATARSGKDPIDALSYE